MGDLHNEKIEDVWIGGVSDPPLVGGEPDRFLAEPELGRGEVGVDVWV